LKKKTRGEKSGGTVPLTSAEERAEGFTDVFRRLDFCQQTQQVGSPANSIHHSPQFHQEILGSPGGMSQR
jgi:hypothetical protein